jgi:hypothetical protein
VDDVLCIHHDAESAIRQIDKYFPMKAGSIGDPAIYLGTKLQKVDLENGVQAWSMSPSKYIKDAVRNVKDCKAPWPTDCICETDVSPELTPEQANYYQSLIGILQWMVEIGRVDMITEVSKLASHMALPREGHFEAVLHIFGWLKCKHGSHMVFDPTYPIIDMSVFKQCDWKEFYRDIREPIPGDAPSHLDVKLIFDYLLIPTMLVIIWPVDPALDSSSS